MDRVAGVRFSSDQMIMRMLLNIKDDGGSDHGGSFLAMKTTVPTTGPDEYGRPSPVQALHQPPVSAPHRRRHAVSPGSADPTLNSLEAEQGTWCAAGFLEVP